MSEGEILNVPFGDLAATVKLFHDGSEMAENLKTDVPPSPDAGEFSGPAGEVLAHLVHVAAQVVIGLGAVADAVTTAADAYRTTDQAARDQVSQLWGN